MNKKVFGLLPIIFMVSLSSCNISGGTNTKDKTHQCEHICEICKLCTDPDCNKGICVLKCTGHGSSQTGCTNLCDTCGLCKDLFCYQTGHENKCKGHTSAHVCAHKCSTCGLCTDSSCQFSECSIKCSGQHSQPTTGQFDTVDSKWNISFDEFGTTFRNALANEINKKVTKTTTYSACRDIGKSAAAYGDSFIPFYHGPNSLAKSTDSINREHTWPNSRGGGPKNGGSNIEADPFMIRPTIENDNSARANYFYGDTSLRKNVWDPACLGYEPARGESARVIFYVATKYGLSNGLSLSNNPDDDSSLRTMGVLQDLYNWNKKYPVTNNEKQINNYLESQGYGRNPFVDHPEYVCFIWNEAGLVTSKPLVYNFGEQ